MNGMEWPAIDGDSPVSERSRSSSQYPSTAGHEKSGGNQGGPSPKAKYSSLTDSELVPRGKGEKNPGKGSEIEPETVCLQAVRALCSRKGRSVIAYLLHNGPASYRTLQG